MFCVVVVVVGWPHTLVRVYMWWAGCCTCGRRVGVCVCGGRVGVCVCGGRVLSVVCGCGGDPDTNMCCQFFGHFFADAEIPVVFRERVRQRVKE